MSPGKGRLITIIPFSLGPNGSPSGDTTTASTPGSAIPPEPGLIGSMPDGANSDAGEHEDDRLAACRHVDAQAVAPADAQPAQRGSGPTHLVLQLRVGEHGAVAVLVLTRQGGPSPIAGLDVAVHAIPG